MTLLNENLQKKRLKKPKGLHKAVQLNEEAELKLLCICLLRVHLFIACALLKFGLGVGRLHILTTGIIGKLAGLTTSILKMLKLPTRSVSFSDACVRTRVLRLVLRRSIMTLLSRPFRVVAFNKLFLGVPIPDQSS